MRSSRNSFDLKGKEDYQQVNMRNQSRSNSPQFHLQELNSQGVQRQVENSNRESPNEKQFTLQNSDSSSSKYQKKVTNNQSNVIHSSSNTKVRNQQGNSSIENIAPHTSYEQIYNNTSTLLQGGNAAEYSINALRATANNKELPQSKAYISAMKALQDKVRILENKFNDQQSMHLSELESLRQEKNQIMTSSTSKSMEFDQRVRQLEVQINLVKEDAEKQTKVFKQLESNLIDKLKEAERENKDMRDREDEFLEEIKVRDKEIAELRDQLKMQGEAKFTERSQHKQKISELNAQLKEQEVDKEQLKKKIDFLEKQFVQYEKDLIFARNDPAKEQHIKQLQDQLYQQADFHERERIEIQIQHKALLEKEQIQNKEKIALLINENDRLYFDLKVTQDQLIAQEQSKNEIQNLIAQINHYQEKSRIQENETIMLKDLADQSRKINQQLQESILKSYQKNNTNNNSQAQLRLQDLQQSQMNQYHQQSMQDEPIQEYWHNDTTPTKNIQLPNIHSEEQSYHHTIKNRHLTHSQNFNQLNQHPQTAQFSQSASYPQQTQHPQNQYPQQTQFAQSAQYPQQTQYGQQAQQEQILPHSTSANRFQNSQKLNSRSASQRRLPNLSYFDNVNREQNQEEIDPYATTIINTGVQGSRLEKSPLRNTYILNKEQEYAQAQFEKSSYEISQPIKGQSNGLSRSMTRNRSIDQSGRQSNAFTDQNIYEQHYKRIAKDKENKKQETLEEIDDVIQQILSCEKEVIQLSIERADLEQEIQEFNGEKIYIDMLRIRMENVRDKIKKKTDTISYLKRKEQELNRSLKDNLYDQ